MPDRAGATNSQTSLLARVGWARRDWQADAFLIRTTPRRGVLFDETNTGSIPPIDLTRTEAYLRGGFGDVDGPFWVQGTAAALGYHYSGIRDPAADTVIISVDPETGDSTFTPILADTGRFGGQYTLSGGVRRGVLRLSATHRMRVVGGSTRWKRQQLGRIGGVHREQRGADRRCDLDVVDDRGVADGGARWRQLDRDVRYPSRSAAASRSTRISMVWRCVRASVIAGPGKRKTRIAAAALRSAAARYSSLSAKVRSPALAWSAEANPVSRIAPSTRML